MRGGGTVKEQEYSVVTDLGRASVAPARVVAGEPVTVRWTYTAGHPVDDSGYIKIVFRSQSDFGVPQFADQKAENYCSVSTTGDCWI